MSLESLRSLKNEIVRRNVNFLFNSDSNHALLIRLNPSRDKLINSTSVLHTIVPILLEIITVVKQIKVKLFFFESSKSKTLNLIPEVRSAISPKYSPGL